MDNVIDDLKLFIVDEKLSFLSGIALFMIKTNEEIIFIINYLIKHVKFDYRSLFILYNTVELIDYMYSIGLTFSYLISKSTDEVDFNLMIKVKAALKHLLYIDENIQDIPFDLIFCHKLEDTIIKVRYDKQIVLLKVIDNIQYFDPHLINIVLGYVYKI